MSSGRLSSLKELRLCIVMMKGEVRAGVPQGRRSGAVRKDQQNDPDCSSHESFNEGAPIEIFIALHKRPRLFVFVRRDQLG